MARDRTTHESAPTERGRPMNPLSPAYAPSDLRRLNLQAVLRVLHSGGIHTISELATRSQLSRPTTKQAVDDLVSSGWVEATVQERDGAVLGRPAQAFEFNPSAGYVLGADIGAHKVVVLIADLNGTIVARSRDDVDPNWDAERRLTALDDVIDRALDAFAPGPTKISDATIATPGTVDREGAVVFNTVIPGWLGQNPARWVAERYGFRTEGASDMPMAALAEGWLGSRRADDVVYLHVGRRLGAAALVGGRPHDGFHRAASQIGLWRALPWRLDYDDLLSRAGTSTTGDARDVFTAAAAGDAGAREAIATFADEIVAGLIPMIVLFDPELLVIGGGISAAGEVLAEPIRERINRETPFPPDVVYSTLGDEAVALGALRLSLDRAEDRLFSELAPPTANRAGVTAG